MSKIKRFIDFTKKKISDFIYPKCDKCDNGSEFNPPVP